MVPARRFMKLKHVITLRHLETMNKIILVTGLIVAYGYLMEHFIAWYSGNEFEQHIFFKTRMQGPYRGIFFLMLFCNVVVPQTYWFQKARRSIVWMWIASVLINVGMWCERFNIIVTSLHQDFIPSNWAMYYPTWVDFSLLFGTISFFGTLFLLFLKFLPAVAVSEVKELRHELEHDWAAHSEGAKP
jgi:molybdopterin-containing oxidoreductase family membrane subunit